MRYDLGVCLNAYDSDKYLSNDTKLKPIELWNELKDCCSVEYLGFKMHLNHYIYLLSLCFGRWINEFAKKLKAQSNYSSYVKRIIPIY